MTIRGVCNEDTDIRTEPALSLLAWICEPRRGCSGLAPQISTNLRPGDPALCYDIWLDLR